MSFRQALFFKEVGFSLHDTMIWAKDGGGAVGSHKCYTQNFEYMFVLSKGKVKTANLLYDKPNGSFKRKSYDQKVGRRKADGTLKRENRKPPKEFSKRNNWWYLTPHANKSCGHPAVFPIEIVRDHILTWSNPGDLVLDPFMGSGTTALAAIETGRDYLGFEIDKTYHELCLERVQNTLTTSENNNVNA